MSGQSGGRLTLSMLNDQLTCRICKGYFIDATTIIECLHSFCRSCIVKYLEKNKYCPICEVQVHKSKPLLNIRPDHTLQDIVYKLVPGCYQNEMRCRREFYERHPDAQLSSMSPEARGEPIESHIYSPDESLSLSLEYYNPSLNDSPICSETDEEKSSSATTKSQPRRYLRCPAAVTVFHLQKLIRAKYGLSEAHRVDIMYKEEPLYGNYTLMDVMYIYHWRRKVPLHLSYRIFESSPKRLKISDDNAHFKQSLTNAGISPIDEQSNGKREWKEVQLKISETGVMSVTGITSPDSKKATKKETLEEEQRRLDESVAASKTLAKPEKVEANKRKSTEEPKLEVKTEPAEKTKKSEPETAEVTEDNNNKQNASGSVEKPKGGAAIVETPAPSIKAKAAPPDGKPTPPPATSGSKIESLSAKLQFQPKVGQVNNTYSKKSQKEKKTLLDKVLKKPEAKEKPRPVPVSSSSSKPPSAKSAATTSSIATTSASFGSCTYSTAPSVSISLTSRRAPTPEKAKEEPRAAENQQNSPLNVPVVSLGQSTSSYPYYVQDLVNSGVLKSPAKSPGASKSPSGPQFNLQSPSMSIFSVPATSAPPASQSTANSITITTTSATSASSASPRASQSLKNSVEITTSYSSVPPCPPAIPIGHMKPAIRKTEILAKGSNVNEICAKIGNSGSKINDICAKIGESSKERDKAKNERIRPEIPDLLKITKKSPMETKTPHIPNVPSFTPANSLGVSSTDKSGSKSSTGQVAPSIATSGGLSMLAASGTRSTGESSKKGSPAVKYNTLRTPPKPWNPTLSKNNYVAAKNQAREAGADGGSSSAGPGNGSKSAPSKSKIFRGRNNPHPKFLGAPQSGLKPMYPVNSEGSSTSPPAKESKDAAGTSGSQTPTLKPSPVSMTKIDPKTLSPIVSSSNSPIVSPPPYSPNARNYSVPFSRELGRSPCASMSPRSSSINMMTSPFIPMTTPTTNPKLMYTAPFIPFDTRFSSGLMRQPINPSAYHSSLPPQIANTTRYYQSRSYIPQTTSGYVPPPPAVQRVPPSSHSTAAPKSPKASVGAAGGAANLAKTETEEKSEGFSATKVAPAAVASDLTKHDEKPPEAKPVGKERERRKSEEEETKEKGKMDEEAKEKVEKVEKVEEKSPRKEEEVKEDKVEGGSSPSKVNGSVPTEASGSAENPAKKEEKPQVDKEPEKPKEKVEEKIEDVVSEKCEEISKEAKAQEAQRNKAES